MNIFVGNLNVAATESSLRSLFETHGKVESVTLVRDRDTDHVRGFAFIEMPNDGEAEAAIQALNGTLLGEQQLTVNEARPKFVGLDGNAPGERRNKRGTPCEPACTAGIVTDSDGCRADTGRNGLSPLKASSRFGHWSDRVNVRHRLGGR